MKLEITQPGLFSNKQYITDTKDVKAISVGSGFFTSYKIKLLMNNGNAIKLSTNDINSIESLLNRFGMTIN